MSPYLSSLLLTGGLESRHNLKLLLQLLYFQLKNISLMLPVNCLFLKCNNNDNSNDSDDDVDIGLGMVAHAFNLST